MYPHRIRLRGPWDCQPLARSVTRSDGRVEWTEQGLPGALRMTMPCRWSEGGLPDFTGRMRYRRTFGSPRRLDDDERVWLTFAGVDASASVWLNGQSMGKHEGAAEPFEFDITSILRQRNELIVEVESPNTYGGLYGEVALEVRCTAFLRSVRAWIEREDAGESFHISGQVVGQSLYPLDLYAILGRSTVAYARAEPSIAGILFHLVSGTFETQVLRQQEAQTSDQLRIRVELVHGGTLWYGIDVPLGIGRGEKEGPSGI
jgi:hypothetical protein